jgi:multiple sugar transport system ATP-binding protein
MAEVKLRGVRKIYDNGFEAVHGINLDIQDGEFMVFVGPSGCAKSTTLRMIAGLEEISGGEIIIGDKIVNDLPPKDRGIAMVFQNYALYPHMTVFENMAFALKLSKMPKDQIKTRVEETAEMLGITELLDRKPRDMSGGQRQRVAVGRAIVRNPDVFLFDEPLSNLDAKLRVHMRVQITQLHQELKKKGMRSTMIYVTHDQVEAMTMGDRICVLNQGNIMQVDSPLNLYNKPANKFVAGFIGSPAMNIVEGLVSEEDSKSFVEIEGVKLLVEGEKAERLRSYTGKKVWFGLRPEHINVNDKGFDKNVVEAEINVMEQMGNEAYAYIQIGEHQYISRIPARKSVGLKSGIKQEFYLDTNKCHIFDYDSEKNIMI